MAGRTTQDFIGFTFDGKSTDDLGIVRVSDGDRFDEELHPEIKDITAEVPGMDGEYYFGSTYGNKETEIKIAYDSLTESQFRELRRVFSGRGIHELIFDERPYKKYLVKLASPIELNYICFDEQKRIEGETTPQGGVRYKKGTRIKEDITPWVYEVDAQGNPIMERRYKGEGTISLIAYYPFAKSVYKVPPYSFELTKDTMIVDGKVYFTLETEPTVHYEPVENPSVEYIHTYYEKVTNQECNEWIVSSGMESANSFDYNKIDKYNNGLIKVYNPGDLETGFRLYIPDEIATQAQGVALIYTLNGHRDSSEAELHLKPIDKMKTYFYEKVSDVAGKNPREKGWYELVRGRYILTEDTTPIEGKTYFEAIVDMGILIDTNNGLITGVQQSQTIIDEDGNPIYATTGNLYNEYVESGRFFKLKTTTKGSYDSIGIAGNENTYIFYDYLYF